MSIITYTRTFVSVLFEKILFLSLIKRIVTFYYETFLFHPNIFKNYSKIPINNIEHKKCLELLKATGSININYIY